MLINKIQIPNYLTSTLATNFLEVAIDPSVYSE